MSADTGVRWIVERDPKRNNNPRGANGQIKPRSISTTYTIMYHYVHLLVVCDAPLFIRVFAGGHRVPSRYLEQSHAR